MAAPMKVSGILSASPPSRVMSRVPASWSTAPTAMNRPAL